MSSLVIEFPCHRNPVFTAATFRSGAAVARWLALLALGLVLIVGQKSFGQTISLSSPVSGTTYVDNVNVVRTITGESGGISNVQLICTYTSGHATASIGTIWTLTLASTAASQSFSFNPSTVTSNALFSSVSPNTAMPDGAYSIKAQYTRVATGATVTSAPTLTSVSTDTYAIPPVFTCSLNTTVDLATDVISTASTTPIRINTTTDVVNLANHGLAANTPVTVSGTNLSSSTTYYVAVVGNDFFKLATTSGGSTFADFTTATGTMSPACHQLANGAAVKISGTNVSSTTTYYVSVINANSFKLTTTQGGSTFVDFTSGTSATITYPEMTGNVLIPGTAASFTYTLGESFAASSAKLVFTGATTVTVTLVNLIRNARVTFDRTSIAGTGVASATASTLPDGTYTVSLTYRDLNSHTSTAATLTNVTFDSATQAPSFTSLADNAVVAHGSTIPYTLPESPLAGSVSLTFSNGTTTTVVPLPDATSATFTFDRTLHAAAIPTGTYTVTLSYRDLAGNPAATAAVTGLSVSPLPTVTGISPVSGPTGTVVTLTGTRFTGATAVKFNTTAATTFSVDSATQITATAPAGPTGTVDLTVTTDDGTSATSANDQFTYIPAPTISSVSPASGSIAGGTTVTLTGTNLTGASAVTLGGTAATGVTVVDATSVTAVTPAHAVGAVDVVVTTPGGTGTAVGAFTYATVAGAPTAATATAGNAQASLSFTAPASNGGSAITSYTVTASPGGATATGAASPLVVTGLTNGTSYTFTVTASNGIGTGVASGASNAVTPKANQTITFSNPGAQNFGTSPTLIATSTSGLAVTFTSSTTSVATITSGGVLTFVGAGTVTINADQAGNGSFNAAPTVIHSFTVNAILPGAPTAATATAGNAQVSVAFTAPASNGGSAITSYTVTASPGGTTASGASSPIVVAGLTNGTSYTFTVTATNSVGTGSPSTAATPVTPAAPVPVVTNSTLTASGTYGTAFAGYTITGTNSPTSFTATGLPPGLSLNPSTGAITGTPTSTAGSPFSVILGAVNASGSGTATLVITVAKASQVITFTPVATTAIGDAVTLAATAGSGLPVTFSVVSGPATVSGTTLTITGTGAVTLRATQAGNNDYIAATADQIVASAAKLDQTITFSPVSTASVGGSVSLSATASSGLPVALSVVSGPAKLSGTTLTFTGIGAITLRATQAGDATYNSATADLAVGSASKLNQTITFAALDGKLANDPAFALTATASSGLPVTFSVVSGPALLAGGMITLTGAPDEVIIRASQAGDATYNAAADVTRVFTVTAAGPLIYFGNLGTGTAPFAAQVSPDGKSGTMIGIIPGSGEGFVASFTPDANGDWVATVTTFTSDSATAASSQNFVRERVVDRIARGVEPPSIERLAITTRTFRGRIQGGFFTGSIDGINAPFTAALVPPVGPTAPIAGYYRSSSLETATGSIYSIVGTTGQVYVLALTPNYVGGNSGTATVGGAYTVATTAGVTVAGAIDAATTAVTGTITQAGKPLETFAGVATTTTRTDRLINLSSRAQVGTTDGDVLITGFVIGGVEPKQVLLRAVGPGLAPLGITNGVSHPRLVLFDSMGKIIAQNEGWAASIGATMGRVGAFPLTAGSADAAISTTLTPGAYTMQVVGIDGPGMALAEIYDSSTNPQAQYQRLINISSRGTVGGSSGVLIGGFVVTGNSPKNILIRGIGPGMAQFGVPGVLADPKLTIYSGSTVIAQNDDWSTPVAVTTAQVAATPVQIASAALNTGAFALTTGSKDAAVIVTLAPGSYTAQVSATNAASGVALVEIYELPE